LVCTFSTKVNAQTVDLAVAKIVISELQTESDASANEEFVEITNVSNEAVDLTGWLVQYRAATGSSWQDKAQLSGQLYIGGSIVISTQGYLAEDSTFFWTTSGGQLASAGGNIRLIGPEELITEDALAWGTGAASGKSLQRRQVEDKLVDTNINKDDFFEDLPDPRNINLAPEPDPDAPSEDTPTEETPPDEDTVTVETPTDPVETPEPEVLPPTDEAEPAVTPEPLLPIVINELMIDPESPALDSNDEWIELYNPNNEVFSLSGYKIQTGSSYSYTYLFVDELIQPFGYFILSSSDSNLALSNTAGAARILDLGGLVSGTAVTYDDVEEGNSYALDSSGTWHWTTTPTQGQVNIFTEAPVVVKKTVVAKKTTAVKAAATKASATKAAATKAATKPKAQATTTAQTDVPVQAAPARPLLLATFAVLAVLYGLYEYREDLSNSLWRARRYIEFRRKNRQGL
jgi:hypothetical protein